MEEKTPDFSCDLFIQYSVRVRQNGFMNKYM